MTARAQVDWGQAAATALVAGDSSAAAGYLRRAIVLSPAHLDLLGNSAACWQRLGRLDLAARWVARALSVDREDIESLTAQTLVAADVVTRLCASRKALALAPASNEIWLRSGILALDSSPPTALARFSRVLALTPESSPALAGMGLALNRLGQMDRMRSAYRRGLSLMPDQVDGWDGLADPEHGATTAAEKLRFAGRAVAIDDLRAAGWHRLGTCLWHARRPAAAARCYRTAIMLLPALVETMANLGAAFRELGQPEATRHWFARAVALAPDSAGAMTNLGTAMPPGAQEAFRWHRRALTQDGAHVHALNNLGSQHLALNDVDAALAWFERAIAAGYPDGEARWNRGVARLVSGDLARGFADYEDRWGLRAFAGWRRPAEKPAWSPGPGNTRTVLVYAEQGIGDTLQFVRYLGQVAAMGWRVVLECQPSLVRLLECVPGASAVVANGKLPPAFDAQVPLLSLPALFGTTLDNIPSTPSYLTSEPAAWPELAAAKGRRVGLVWAGNPEHKNDANRSLDIDALRRLASGLMRRSDLALFSLQVGARRNDLAAIPGLDWTDLSPRLKDFADTAAAIAALDLVVAVDTSVIHLTGALGRAGSLLLPFSPDWRWLLGRSDSPWYPSLRLYRQVAAGNWSEPIDALLRDLDRHAS